MARLVVAAARRRAEGVSLTGDVAWRRVGRADRAAEAAASLGAPPASDAAREHDAPPPAARLDLVRVKVRMRVRLRVRVRLRLRLRVRLRLRLRFRVRVRAP